MDILKIGSLVVPTDTLVKYDVTFIDVNGSEETTEAGYDYIEQVRSQVPTIDLEWKNIKQTDVDSILKAVKPSLFDVSYYFGEIHQCTMKRSSEPKLNLLYIDKGIAYFNLSMTIKG